MRWSAADLFMLILVVLAAIALWLLSTGRIGAQVVPPKPKLSAVDVEYNWRDGFLLLDQKGNGIKLALREKAITSTALVKKDAPYAKVVYRDDYDLVVIGMGASEYRVRCPDYETAQEIAEFIIGGSGYGEGQN